MPHTITIDLDSGQLIEQSAAGTCTHGLDTPEAFQTLSQVWLRSGWQNKQVYSFTWLGRPIIQLPEDLLRVQEVLYTLKPDVLVETGIAHGGSLVFFASLFQIMGRGRVVGVEIEIRPHNRAAIEEHELFDRITLIEGDSANPAIVTEVQSTIKPGERVLVMLDGNHTKEHVSRELELYAPLVTVGSYIVAADGIMGDLSGLPRHADQRPNDDWHWNNPRLAAEEFVARHDNFILQTPEFLFNEGTIRDPVTYWPGGWIRRVR